MRRLNIYSHIPFLRQKLMVYVPEDSIASRLKRTIPAEINYVFAGDTPNDVYSYEVSYQILFPVRALFEWIVKHGGLTVEDLADTSGQLFDDNKQLIPDSLIRPISGVEQMAAFGLWFIDSELEVAGPSNDEDYDEHGLNSQGWYKVDVIDHRAECLMNAYQALWYAERLSHTVELSADEKASVDKFNFSAFGRRGAVARHRPMSALRDYALSLYNPREWKSASQAAYALQGQIMEHGRTINAVLQPTNAQRTIAEWFRKKSV
ncbi:hypothetical protein NX784_17555 [Massilia pinisoli]|uniref:Uncharacterized protein n=1 Tax=Massilia pinisoli TaxID=1772194 RepID=A0ABT1ZU03_9BURK|nr:hypothetical protein [Massilia pinisoli]MCS0583400.1 hypothetical protein [Massilia pinisoli]